MNLKTTIVDMLASARKVVTDGAEVIPAWRIATPEGQFLILTRFDPAKPEQAKRVLKSVQRFMVWRMALGYVLVAESWTGADKSGEALIATGVTRKEQIGAMQRIHRKPHLCFDEIEWLTPAATNPALSLLPKRIETISNAEQMMLGSIFAPTGEIPAVKLT